MQLARQLGQRIKGDKVIWLLLAFMFFASVLAVYSSIGIMVIRGAAASTHSVLLKHLIILIVGAAAVFFLHRIDYTRFQNMAPMLMLAALILLVVTLFFGIEINESRRWIKVPIIGLTVQTSDFARLALIVYLARTIAKYQGNIKSFKTAFLPIFLPVLICCGLILPEDLSTSVILFGTCLIMMFVGRMNMKFIFGLLFVGFLCIAGVLLYHALVGSVGRSQTWISRATDWWNNDPTGDVLHSIIAISNGGLLGTGAGSSQEISYIAYPYTDFIFAIIVEEYGIVAGALLICLYAVLAWRCVRLITRSNKAFGNILVIGLASSIILQALINMAVALDLVPPTGVTLPFISLGGTSIVFNCIGLGIILSVSHFALRNKQKNAVADA